MLPQNMHGDRSLGFCVPWGRTIVLSHRDTVFICVDCREQARCVRQGNTPPFPLYSPRNRKIGSGSICSTNAVSVFGKVERLALYARTAWL